MIKDHNTFEERIFLFEFISKFVIFAALSIVHLNILEIRPFFFISILFYIRGQKNLTTIQYIIFYSFLIK